MSCSLGPHIFDPFDPFDAFDLPSSSITHHLSPISRLRSTVVGSGRSEPGVRISWATSRTHDTTSYFRSRRGGGGTGQLGRGADQVGQDQGAGRSGRNAGRGGDRLDDDGQAPAAL